MIQIMDTANDILLATSIYNVVCLTIVLSFIVGILALCAFLQKSNSKMEKYRRFSTFTLTVSFIFITLFFIYAFPNVMSRNSTETGYKETNSGFSIDSYDVEMYVHESNTVDVTETITVNFYEANHHGIYRTIPEWLPYTGKNGKTISRRSEITTFRALEENYTLSEESGRKKLKIGDSFKTLPVGPKTYIIKYSYIMGNDPYKGFDEFIFHVYGDYWSVPINNPTLRITMPKDFSKDNIKFFADKKRINDITSHVYYYVEDNVLVASLDKKYQLNKALTVDIELPEGYFEKGTTNYGYTSMILCYLAILFALITFLLWSKYGKDYKKENEIIEPYSPEKYDAAEIGYIYRRDVGRKLPIALILQLAAKGYIQIDEEDNKCTITNLCPIGLDKRINRKIIITKLKDAKKKDDIELMNILFRDGSTESTVIDEFNVFYKRTEKLVKNKTIRIDSDTINDFSIEDLERIKNELKEEAFKGKQPLTSNEQLVFDHLFAEKDVNVLSDDNQFYKIFDKINNNLKEQLDDKINDITSYKVMAFTSIFSILGVAYFTLAYSTIEDLDPRYSYLYLMAAIAVVAQIIFVVMMKRRNPYGEVLHSKIDGFKNYIENVQREKITTIANENDNYFYDILPYAYVLGLSKTWISHFDNLPNPKKLAGNFNYYNNDSFADLFSSIHYPSGSGDSSSGGGGCSSCGGGCSSCGGGGSW